MKYISKFESFGRDYSMESLYSVIKDELINHHMVKEWLKMYKSSGDLNSFLSTHDGEGDDLRIDGGYMSVNGNKSLLGATISPILSQMGIITGDQLRNDPNTIKIVNRISDLLYQDLIG